MSRLLMEYYEKLIASFKARDAGNEAREDELLSELDKIWLDMPAIDKNASDVVGDFAMAVHEGDMARVLTLSKEEIVRNSLFASTNVTVMQFPLSAHGCLNSATSRNTTTRDESMVFWHSGSFTKCASTIPAPEPDRFDIMQLVVATTAGDRASMSMPTSMLATLQ